MSNIYNYELPNVDNTILKLSSFKNKVLLIVNTATGCGFTPQYEDLEKLYKKYHDKGFEIIDIPCNQFGFQTPQDDKGIHEFCKLNYNTSFIRIKKSEVNGENELPIYTFLKKEKGFNGFGNSKMGKLLDDMLKKNDPDYDKKSDIKWNFTKFLIDSKGNVDNRYEPTIDIKIIEKRLIELLK